MYRGFLAVSLLCAFVLAVSGPSAATTCPAKTEIICKTRKQPTCGPVELLHGLDNAGAPFCDRVTMQVPRAAVMPALRRVRCTLFGDDTSVRFSANNYQSMIGPVSGDTIEVRHGNASFELFGAYETSERITEIFFENLGPGERIVLRCAGFGPR